MNPLLKGFKAATRPTDRRLPWQWCEDHVVVDNTSPMPGRWRSDSSPWVKDVMEEYGNNHVRRIAIKCSAQSSKTQTILCLLCWSIAEDPGPAMWVMAAKDDARDFFKDRVAPTFDHCEPVSRMMIEQEGLNFRFASMPLYFVGAGSRSKLQSKPIRWLLMDEVRNYPPGALDTVMKRTRSFWNSRQVVISTPDMENDAVDRAFKEGDQRTWHFPCPKCGQLQPLKLEQLRWDTNDQTRSAGGEYIFDVLAETIRYECVSCGHPIQDTPAERRWICRQGRFVKANPNAPRHIVSFTWNALLPTWVSWRSIVEEFLKAQAASRSGDLSPLKTFFNETMGESWEDRMGEVDDYDFLGGCLEDYDYGEPWAEERCRFMAADKQEAGGEHYWWVVRSFGPFGKSRLVAYGRCNTTSELEELRVTYGVPAKNAMIDSGFKAREVYRFCASTGWKAFKGDDAPHFLVQITDAAGSTKTVRQLWRRSHVDPHFGTPQAGRFKPIPLFQWSNDSTKDLLAEYLKRLVGEFTLPRQIANDYLRQLTAERRVEQKDTRGRLRFVWTRVRRDNHIFDCELMILVAAVITKVVATQGPATMKKEQEPAASAVS